MRKTKYIAILVLAMFICFNAAADKRPERKSMKELTDPNSPSFVPYPYPKKRKEIIDDIKYFVQNVSEGANESYVKGVVPVSDIMLENLFSANPQYTFGKIIKVKNRIDLLPDNYSWLIFVNDGDGNIVMRIAIRASGLLSGCAAIGEDHLKAADPRLLKRYKRFMKSRTDDEIKTILSESLGRAVADHEIVKIERVAYPSTMGWDLFPLWEIKMTGGETYYYSIKEDMVYGIDKKIAWKKGNNGRRPFKLSLVPHRNYLPDMENDQLVILTEKPRKK